MDNIKYEVVDDTTFNFKPASTLFPNTTQGQSGPKPTSYNPPTPTPTSSNTNTHPLTKPYIPSTANSQPNTTNGVGTQQNVTVNAFNFDEKIRDYIRKHNPRIYILTPCYGSMCHVNYITCLMKTMNIFRTLGVDIIVEFCKNDSLVPRARNNLIAKAMNDPKMTHIMFIDSDITWDPTDILKLMVSNKHIIGGAYPLKNYFWDRLLKDQNNPYNSNIVQSWIKAKDGSQLKDIIQNENLIKHKLLAYNINFIDNTLKIEENITKVRHVATGFMMIQRYVIENMFKAFPSTKYTDDVHFLKPEENRFAYALFDCGVEDDHYYSEDWLFCHRWQKMGGDVYIDVSINLIHSGMEDYNGSFITSLLI